MPRTVIETGEFAPPTYPSNRPADLPHGLLVPPDHVRELVVRERTRYPDKVSTLEYEEQILNDWTVGWYFESTGHEVLYRSTPEGPIVLAVGYEEGIPLMRDLPVEARSLVKHWML